MIQGDRAVRPTAGGDPGGRGADDAVGRRWRVHGVGIFTSGDPAKPAKAIVEAVMHLNDPDILLKISRDLGEAMVVRTVASTPETEKMTGRGW